MSDLTFAEAASVSASGAGGSTSTSTVSTGGTSDGGSGMGGCTYMLPDAKRVFVSSATYQGNLDSLGPGDPVADAAAECQRLAQGACLGGSWMAWLSATNQEPYIYFADSGLRYVNMHGEQVVSSLEILKQTGNLDAKINYDEFTSLIRIGYVWTGTNGTGTAVNVDCEERAVGDWVSTSNQVEGVAGDLNQVSNGWSNTTYENCNARNHLYCFEQ